MRTEFVIYAPEVLLTFLTGGYVNKGLSEILIKDCEEAVSFCLNIGEVQLSL